MRLIDADALLEALQNQCTSLDISYKVFQILDNAPTIQRDGWKLVPNEPTEKMIEAAPTETE